MATAVKELDKAAILAVLDHVMDPEIPAVSITDLGIVRGVATDPPRVQVTPTYSGCPATIAIEQAIRHYVQDQAWQVQAIQEALDDYRSGHAELVPHEEVMARLEARIASQKEQ